MKGGIEFQGADYVVAVEKQGRLFSRLALRLIGWEKQVLCRPMMTRCGSERICTMACQW